MYQLLYKYFILNKKISIPGIGFFTMHSIPAKLDFVTGVLHAPKTKVDFKAEDAVPDKPLFQYLSKELKIDEWQAAKQFQEFSQELKESIENKQPITFPGIGTVQKGINDIDLIFTEEAQIVAPFLNDIKLNGSDDSRANLVELYTTGDNLIITEETDDDKLEMIVKEKGEDYWWVYAVILALMGVGALLYYYI